MDTYYEDHDVQETTCRDHGIPLEPVWSDNGPDPVQVGAFCPVCDDQEADQEAAENGELPYAWLEEVSA